MASGGSCRVVMHQVQHVHSINPTSRIAAVALIECPECQKNVSDKAARLPE